MDKLTLRFGIAFGLACMIVGCNSDGISGYSPPHDDGLTSQQRTDNSIKKIQDNPNMPESAKQMAIGQIRAHANMGQRMSQKR